jgi:hypothetical protein
MFIFWKYTHTNTHTHTHGGGKGELCWPRSITKVMFHHSPRPRVHRKINSPRFARDLHEDYCLIQGFYSCTNIMTKKQAGEERLYSSYISTLLFITKGSQDWNSSRSGSSSWCRGHGGMFLAGLLLLACSACSLIEPRLPAQRWSHPQGAFLPWSLIEKMLYSWISWRHFLNWSSFFCDNSSCVKLTQN